MIAGEKFSTNRPRKNRPLKQGDPGVRVRQRHKPSRVRRVLKVSIVTGLLVMIVIAGRGVSRWAGEWTEIQQITVVGLDRVSREEVLSRLALPPQANLISFDADLLTTRLTSHPWIASVTFDRVFPNAVIVQVSERQPAAVIGTSSTEPYFLDVEGYVLPGRIKEENGTLPIVEGVSSRFLAQNSAEGHQRAKQGIHIANLLAQQFPGRPRVDVSDPYTIIVDLPNFRFHFGRDVEDQWQRFLVLYPTVKTEIIGRSQEVDLRFAQKIIFRKRTL